MFASATGAKARKLWDGDHSGYEQYDLQGDMTNDGESEADLALCEILAFWTCKDGNRIDSLFRQSKLYRPERWAKADYAKRTIAKAIEFCGDTYSGKAKEDASNTDVEGHESQKLSLSDIPLSDTYNAKRLLQKYGHIIKHCGFWDKTYICSNGIWQPDYNKSIVELAKSIANDMFVEAKNLVV